MTKRSLVKKEFISTYTSSQQSIIEGNQDSNLEAKSEGRNGYRGHRVEECCFLLWSQWHAQPALLYTLGPPSQGCATHSGLGPLTSIISQENAPPDMPECQCDMENSSIEVLSSQVTVGLCQVDSWKEIWHPHAHVLFVFSFKIESQCISVSCILGLTDLCYCIWPPFPFSLKIFTAH